MDKAGLPLYGCSMYSPTEPGMHRFYFFGTLRNKDGKNMSAGRFIEREEVIDRNAVKSVLLECARERGFPVNDETDCSVPTFFALPPVPRPKPEDGRPLLQWKVEVSFVCDDVKFGHETSGVFVWPEEPREPDLQEMANVLISDALAFRGDGPDYTPYCRVLRITVSPSLTSTALRD